VTAEPAARPGDGVTLVIAAPYDAPARWMAGRLRALSSAEVVVVSPQALLGAPGFEQRIGADGVDTVIHVDDGSLLRGSRIASVLNRFDRVAAPSWEGAPAAERAYVLQELHAIALGWLAGLAVPVVNPATPQGLSGACLPVARWRMLAAANGLPTVPYCEGAPFGERGGELGQALREVCAIGNACLGDPPSDVAHSLPRLAAAARTPVLCAEFLVDAMGRWRFARASPWPDFRRFGEAAVVPLARLLGVPLDGAPRPADRASARAPM
jgi:hypothetical protein